jgi:peptidoglycan/xylan/chitin deacetylase (PgdA/CDA1 family)
LHSRIREPVNRARQRGLLRRVLCVLLLCVSARISAQGAAILCYHRFAPGAVDSMTLRTAVFEQQITRLRAEGYQFLPLHVVLEGLYQGGPLPDKAVAITVDDGHRSVYTELRPIIVREQLPVTLFIYPSAISNASYAMTWEQLAEMQQIPNVDIESQTYWHPDFNIEKKRLSPEAYAAFVEKQLTLPRTILNRKLGVNATLLAWPFGIRDASLDRAAASAGYRYAFTIDGRHARGGDTPYAIPRLRIADAQGVDGLLERIRSAEPQEK